MSTVIEPAKIRRILARNNCIDHVRRAASAAAAAGAGETDPDRAAILKDVHQRLRSAIAELGQLAQ
jgi:hypothetical protein